MLFREGQTGDNAYGAATFLSPAMVAAEQPYPMAMVTAAGAIGIVLALRALASTATGMSPLLGRFATPAG